MKKRRIFTFAAALLACSALAFSVGRQVYAENHPKAQIASPFLQLEAAQDQEPFRLERLTQLGTSGRSFQMVLSRRETWIRVRTAYGPDGWAAYYLPQALAADLQLDAPAGQREFAFTQSDFQGYTLLEPADPEEAPVSSLTYRNQNQLVTTAAPYRYLLAETPQQGWVAFYEGLSPQQALDLLEQDAPLDWPSPAE